MKSCKNCDAFHEIYRPLGFFYYKALSPYYCSERDEIIDVKNVCDKWRGRKKPQHDFSKERFDEAEENLRIIKKLAKTLR